MKKNTAIIVAAGTGTRLGGDTPKQFRLINGKPVLFHTLIKFERCDAIDKIVLVLADDRLGEAEELRGSITKIESVVPGGATRSQSVRKGLKAVSEDGIVAIHDGARPLVTVDEIERTVAAAEETGAACLVMPVADTVKEISEGRIARTIDREKLRRAATPQCFKLDVIRRAFDSAAASENPTDESSIVEAFGIPVTAVEGSPRNIKLTVEDDLKTASALLEDDALIFGKGN